MLCCWQVPGLVSLLISMRPLLVRRLPCRLLSAASKAAAHPTVTHSLQIVSIISPMHQNNSMLSIPNA